MGMRGADAGDHVLALRVHQVFAEEDLFAGRGIAGKADAGAGVLAHVAEDHALHVDRGAEPVVDVVDAAIGLGAVAIPTAEDGVAGLHQLLQRLLGKSLPVSFLISFLYSTTISFSAAAFSS